MASPCLSCFSTLLLALTLWSVTVWYLSVFSLLPCPCPGFRPVCLLRRFLLVFCFVLPGPTDVTCSCHVYAPTTVGVQLPPPPQKKKEGRTDILDVEVPPLRPSSSPVSLVTFCTDMELSFCALHAEPHSFFHTCSVVKQDQAPHPRAVNNLC